MSHEGFTTGEAAKYIRRHTKTLQVWDRLGILPAKRTSTGRRYWLKSDLDKYLGKTSSKGPQKIVAYCRVSSQSQRPDLKNQRQILEDFCIARGLANVDFIEEIGGGMNFKRPLFLKLLSDILNNEIHTLVVAHKDRLARFGFEILEFICAQHNCELLVLNTEKVSPEQEMVQDLMAITHGFSSRLNGLHTYRKSLKKALETKEG